MQCPNCGTNNPPEARFCTECGTPFNESPQVQAPYVPGSQLEPSPRPKRRVGVVVGVVIGVVLLVIGAVSVVVGMRSCSSAATASTHGVVFMVNIGSGYDTSSSRIPLQITGTDANGNEVDKTIFLAYSGVDVELPAGDYEAKVLGSPISSTGTIYKVPTYVARFSIPTSLDPDEEYHLPASQAFSFVAIDPADLTDEQVADAIAWARKDEQSGADVGTLEKTVEDARSKATK